MTVLTSRIYLLLKRILVPSVIEALIGELEERGALDSGRTNTRIIEKGNPNPSQLSDRLKDQSDNKPVEKKDGQ
jgi:hypothetical protein